MRNSIFAILVTAATLGLSFSIPVAPASAAKSNHDCAHTQSADCTAPTSGYYDQAPAMGYGAPGEQGSSMYLMRTRDENRFIPTAGPGGAFDNPCSNISGGGSGMPAYLYGKCY